LTLVRSCLLNKTEYLAAIHERVRDKQSREYSHIVTALGLGGLGADKVRSAVQKIKTDMASMKDKLLVAQREISEYKTKLEVAERQVERYRTKLGLVPLEKVSEKVSLADNAAYLETFMDLECGLIA
jgi:hypothetical protein